MATKHKVMRVMLILPQLKLSEDGMKNLCKKFGEVGNHVTMVRYEDMISYLAKSRMEALKAPPPLPSQRLGAASRPDHYWNKLSIITQPSNVPFYLLSGPRIRRSLSTNHNPRRPNNNILGR